jgi:regulatory protein
MGIMKGKTERIFRSAETLAKLLLSRRDYSIAEMRGKLQAQGLKDPEVEKAIQILEYQGLLNDERYAERIAESSAREKLLGPEKIRQKLIQKGISNEWVTQAIEKAEENLAAKERLRRLLESKCKNHELLEPKEKKKVANFLYRRGYFWEDIIEALQETGGYIPE